MSATRKPRIVVRSAIALVLLSSLFLSSTPPAAAQPPSSKVVALDEYPVSGECRVDGVSLGVLGTVYVVIGSWRPYDSPYEGTVTCLVNGQVATVPVWLPSGQLPMAPDFPIVPYGMAVGVVVVAGDQLDVCVRIDYLGETIVGEENLRVERCA